MGVKQPNDLSSLDRAVLTVSEVCKVFGLRKSSAYLAISRGQIPSIRIGSQIRVPRDAVERMLKGE